jgi:hypothetical protein
MQVISTKVDQMPREASRSLATTREYTWATHVANHSIFRHHEARSEPACATASTRAFQHILGGQKKVTAWVRAAQHLILNGRGYGGPSADGRGRAVGDAVMAWRASVVAR